MAPQTNLFNGAAWYLVFLFSTTVHEASHALVALKLGDDTAHRGGQVTLDPIPHIRREPFGMVIVPLLSYLFGGWMIGWASAPYNPEWARRNPRRAGLMALAGPVSNLLLCLSAAVVIRIGLHAGWFEVPVQVAGATHIVAAAHEGMAEFAAVLLSICFYLNLLLFAFNLVPLPPLDGSSVPLICLSETAAAKYSAFMRSPGIAIFGMVLAWQVFGQVAPNLYHWGLQALYPGYY